MRSPSLREDHVATLGSIWADDCIDNGDGSKRLDYSIICPIDCISVFKISRNKDI